jgi:hypothetical protein
VGKVNEFTEAMESVVGQIRLSKKKADKAKPVPFGLERIDDRRTAAARFEGMNEKQKREFIQRTGVKETVNMLRGQNGA